MSLALRDYVSLVIDEQESAKRSPLSLRRAMLAAVLLNNLPDKIFATYRSDGSREGWPAKVWNADDLPEYRARIEDEFRDIAIIHALCRFDEVSPKLVRETVPVPESETEKLALGDFMISLYNGVSVQMVLIRMPDGATLRFHEVMERAVHWWQNEFKTRKLFS